MLYFRYNDMIESIDFINLFIIYMNTEFLFFGQNLLPVVAEGAYDVDGRKEKSKETCDTKVILAQG